MLILLKGHWFQALVLGFPTEKEPMEYTYKEIYHKELAHVIMEAIESSVLGGLSGWRPRENWCSNLKTIWQEELML